ncbi:hypothetical protein PCASD_03817 [Puccinia coronata f. sp. avenae]|uniref:Uncharacterized protein n=1 Tax=Puccinia coronata f. sp. avenae TaxID=200324 RepID=A0A2N5V2N9_9BASI|nr:hypothetical protein PCASD_03817 [Puccinia coronata f. sp. avenae]
MKPLNTQILTTSTGDIVKPYSWPNIGVEHWCLRFQAFIKSIELTLRKDKATQEAEKVLAARKPKKPFAASQESWLHG